MKLLHEYIVLINSLLKLCTSNRVAFLVPHSRFQFKQQHFEVYEVYIINDVNMYALGNTKSSEFIYWYLWLGKIHGCHFKMIIFHIRLVNDVVLKTKRPIDCME